MAASATGLLLMMAACRGAANKRLQMRLRCVLMTTASSHDGNCDGLCDQAPTDCAALPLRRDRSKPPQNGQEHELDLKRDYHRYG